MSLDLSELITLLSAPEAYAHPVDKIDVQQTHISVVFLAGPFAYKIKKPVNLGFLDFSTLEKRKHFCEEEVRLNRRLAPQVYLGVVPVTGASGPEIRFGGAGPIVEWAVQMKRLPSDATLESRLARGEVTREQIEALAVRLAAFHHGAESSPRISSFGRFAQVAQNVRENLVQAEPLVGATVNPIVFERLRALTEAYLTQYHDLIENRAAENVPRDTHGDLHLDHVYLFLEEAPPHDLVIIDCIEFADRFRFADPVADMAFLAMDLSFHGRRDLARVFADAYIEASGDGAGRRLLPVYSAYRAAVRAKVEGMKLAEMEIGAAERVNAEGRAKAHWLLALGELDSPASRPALLLVAGLPGSGKSTLAKTLAASANFDVLRSDVVRKELAAAQAGTHIYAEAWTERTCVELLARAEQMFWQGKRVLIDANFREDSWRMRFLQAATRWCVPMLFLHCQADPDVVRQRLAVRKNDASEADWNVFQELQSSWQPVGDDMRPVTFALNTSHDVERSKSRALAALAAAGLV